MSTIKKIFKHLFKGDLFNIYKRRRYVKKHTNDKNISDNDYLVGYGKITLGYKMDLDNPQTFNEKINYYKIHYDDPLMHEVVDKIKAKEYVVSKGLDSIVIKTIATYNTIDDFVLENMPQKFVIKNTLDSGGVFVCKDKTKIKTSDIKKKLTIIDNEIFKGKHWALERAYVGGNNQNRIIVEEFLDNKDGHAPLDYKFFCFEGEPKFLYVGSERDLEVKFDFFDINFNWIDVKQGHKNNLNKPQKPKNYDRMIEICRILSKDFPQVRVDLYNLDGKIYFGELTFYSNAGLLPFKPFKYDYEFGKFFDIGLLKKSKYFID